MSKIKGGLHAGEKINKEYSVNPLNYLWIYILSGILILTILGAIVGIPLIIITELKRRAHKYYITNVRVIYQYVFLSRTTSSIIFDKIQNIQYTQGITERMFGLGEVRIHTSGTNRVEIIIKGVKNPAKIKKEIQQNIIKKRNQKKNTGY